MFIGIDPGASGAAALIDGGRLGDIIRFNKATLKDFRDWLEGFGPTPVVLEAVHSMPGQGVSTTFKFGQSFGEVRGLLIGLRFPFQEVRPQLWQRGLGLGKQQGQERKRALKAIAQERFPDWKVTADMADAILIADWAERQSR